MHNRAHWLFNVASGMETSPRVCLTCALPTQLTTVPMCTIHLVLAASRLFHLLVAGQNENEGYPV